MRLDVETEGVDEVQALSLHAAKENHQSIEVRPLVLSDFSPELLQNSVLRVGLLVLQLLVDLGDVGVGFSDHEDKVEGIVVDVEGLFVDYEIQGEIELDEELLKKVPQFPLLMHRLNHELLLELSLRLQLVLGFALKHLSQELLEVALHLNGDEVLVNFSALLEEVFHYVLRPDNSMLEEEELLQQKKRLVQAHLASQNCGDLFVHSEIQVVQIIPHELPHFFPFVFL